MQSLLDYAEAALLGVYARAEGNLTYAEYIKRDKPVGYWRLNERKLARYAKDEGRLSHPAKYV